MARLLAVVVVVGLLVWGLAFLDFGRPRTRTRSQATREPAAAAEPEPAAPRAAAKVAREPAPEAAARAQEPPLASPVAQRPQQGHETASKGPATAPTGPAPAATAQPRADAPAAKRGALSTATGELGEGILSPEYAEMERSYAHEPRDGAWAEAEEQRLRALLGKSSVASEVVLVNCQETLCRVMFESDDYDLYRRLLSVPGFRDLTGLEPSSPYSHRSGQLSVYFPRRGSGAHASR